MARRTGDKDRDHAAKRAALLDRIGRHLVAALPGKPSLRELASAAGVTIPTLNHYFGGRDDILAAVMAHQATQGSPHLAVVADGDAPFATSIESVVRFILDGLVAARVVDLHAVGLQEAAGSPRLGPAYLTSLLEPTLQAVEARLRRHVERGEMRPVDPRGAALALVAPLLLAALHQQALGGDAVRPLDFGRLAGDLAHAFVLGHRR